jgi:hypothetical protein
MTRAEAPGPLPPGASARPTHLPPPNAHQAPLPVTSCTKPAFPRSGRCGRSRQLHRSFTHPSRTARWEAIILAQSAALAAVVSTTRSYTTPSCTCSACSWAIPPTRSGRLRSRAAATSRSQRTPTHTTARPARAAASRSCDDPPPKKTSSKMRPVPQRPIAARPAYQDASARRKFSPTVTAPFGPNSMEPGAPTGPLPSGRARIRSSTSPPPASARTRSSSPSVIHVGPSSRCRQRAMEVLPELEPPFKTTTGATHPTVHGSAQASLRAWQ